MRSASGQFIAIMRGLVIWETASPYPAFCLLCGDYRPAALYVRDPDIKDAGHVCEGCLRAAIDGRGVVPLGALAERISERLEDAEAQKAAIEQKRAMKKHKNKGVLCQ